MAEIYIYRPDCEDFSTIGECGRMTPSRYEWDGAANSLPEIVMEHPIDPMGRYLLLQEGWIIKAPAPVRLMPEISGGSYVTSVQRWTVSGTATKAQRYVYSKRQGGKKKKLLKAGWTVIVTSAPAGAQRWKIKCGRVTGWISPDALQDEVDVTIPATPAGMEEAAASWESRDQLFRIYSVNKADEKITVYARAIAGDAIGNVTTYDTNAAVGLQDAADGIVSNTIDDCDLTVATDIQGTRVGVHARDMNPIAALLNPEEGLAARWDAQVVFDDDDIYLLHQAGANRGVRIEYAKNLSGVNMDINVDDVVTHVRPVGENKNGSPLYLEDNDGLVACPNAGNYPYKRIHVLEVSEAKVGGKGANKVTVALARTRMRDAANDLIATGIDQPSVNAKISFENMGTTRRYAQYRKLQGVFLYDTVAVWHPRLNIDILTTICRVKWDGLREKVIDTEMGDMADMSPKVSSWQISGKINGGKLIPGTVGAGALLEDCINARHVQAESINAEAINAQTLTADTAVVQQLNACALVAVNANIQNLTAGRINTDELYASMAQMASAIVTDASIASADIGDLAAQVAEIAQAQIDGAEIEEANITDANVQTLSAALALIMALTAQSAEIEAANIDWAHIANLTAQAETVATSNIGSAAISSANIDWAEIKSLAVALGNINEAQIQQATIDQADIDTLNAGIADVLTITAQHGDFEFATVQRLLASSFILEQGVGDTLFIKNLTATSAMFVQATLGELCLKGDDGKYYDVSVAADGTIHTQDTGYTDADIVSGVAPDGKKVVVTEAAIDELNSTNIRAESLIVSEIFAAALTADVISAGQAFIASATIPELYVTAITAIGETLTISAGQINMTAGGTLEDYEEDIAADIDGLSSDLTEVREVAEGAAGAIRSMAVGGVNLVDDSALIAIAGTDDPETSYRELASGLLPGMAYTLSMESATLTAGSAAGMTLEAVRLPDADQGETEETILLTDTLDFSGGHQKYTFVTADDGHTYALRIYAGIKGAGNGRVVELEKVKLERGTFATMWTESLSDAEARLVELSSQLSVTASGLSSIVTHVTQDVDGTIRNVNDYFRFDGSDPNNPKLILGTDNSPMTMELTNSRLSFLWHGDAVAYFSNNKLYVTNVEAIERMSIGTDSNGFLDIVTTATGVGFLWRS